MAAYFSSPDIDDSAIDAVIAEAADLCALEQIATLNTAHLSDSSLPTNLETRFRKLKSFPEANNPSNQGKENTPRSLKALHRSESMSTLSDDPKPYQTAKIEVLSNEPEILEPKSKSGISPIAMLKEPPSPPRHMCCFWCSPKRIQRGRGSGDGGDWAKDDDDFFAEFGSFSMKEHRRKLKKAWKEQEKANREAEKIADLVKEISDKINETAAIDELLHKEFK